MAALMQTEIGEQALAELRANKALAESLADRYGTVKAITNGKEYEAVRLAIADHRTLRLDIEKRRKELVDGALKWQREVNAVAKEITQTIEASEDRLKAIKDAEDEKKERAKREKAEAERKALEEKIRAEREAEEIRLKAEREEKERQLAEAREAIRLERERIEAENAERERILAEREAEFAKERERVEAERRKLDQERIRMEREEAERKAKARAEEEAKARAEAQKLQDEERAKAEAERERAEAERIEALKPDREKLLAFARRIRATKAPTCQTQEATALVVIVMKHVMEAAKYLEDSAGALIPAATTRPTQPGE